MDEYLWECNPQPDADIRTFAEQAGVTRPTAVVLLARGIPLQGVDGFLRPALRDLLDPYRLAGAEAAAERLWRAVMKGERILIHGDYDADGITATALMSWVLRTNGALCECFLPHRIDDGYGLTVESIEKACSDNCHLLLSVDCGITSYDAVKTARSRGLDLVITDHHMPGNECLDADVVVDPKLPGTPLELQDLAGVGVAFKVCHAFLKYGRRHGLGGEDTDLKRGLDLVALGTVADIVPLLHENRLLVRHGLEVLARQQRPGIHALCELAGIGEDLSTSDITYRLAPRLNATGRMGDPTDSLRLLEAGSMVEAVALARTLDEHNRSRQQIEETVVQAAEEQIAAHHDTARDRTIVVYQEDWHQGVVGIVASRLARKYHRPAVVLTRDTNGQLTGSARSIRRLNLIDLLEQCHRSLVRFGGHAMAAGLSLESSALEAFREGFETAVSRVLGLSAMKPQLEVCGAVDPSELGAAFFEELRLLEPFGHGNPEPVFLARHVVPERLSTVGKCHTRGMIRDRDGGRIAFIAFSRTPGEFPPAPWNMVYTPQINRYNGMANPQARLIDVRSVGIGGPPA